MATFIAHFLKPIINKELTIIHAFAFLVQSCIGEYSNSQSIVFYYVE